MYIFLYVDESVSYDKVEESQTRSRGVRMTKNGDGLDRVESRDRKSHRIEEGCIRSLELRNINHFFLEVY